MGRFFFIISAVLHGILLLLLFSWEISVADRLHLKNILEVSLVEKIEEMKPRMVLPRMMNKPEKMKSAEKKEILPASERRDVQKEEKREERIWGRARLCPRQALFKNGKPYCAVLPVSLFLPAVHGRL